MTDLSAGGDARLSRRDFVKRAGAGGLLLASGSLLSACGSSGSGGGTIKLGFVSPRTGPAAGFGEGDAYVIGLARKAFEQGIEVGGKTYDVEIIAKDGQSNPQRGAQVANDLINSSNVDLMLTTSTPETTNPVSDACEAAGMPCVSTVVPWEAWYFGRGAKPGQPSPFHYTYHFCFGVQDFADAYTHLWPQVPTNKRVGVMWPNDADGNAIRENLGPLLEKAGYKIIDPGAYQDGTNDYSSQISTFKKNNCEIFNTFPIPPDFVTFWRQANQQGYTDMVKIAQIAKTGLFPSQVEAVGALGDKLATATYWKPSWPYSSTLTGISSKQLGDGYTKSTGRQWNQQLGPSLALFDIAEAALKKAGDPKDKKKVADAMKNLTITTLVGKLAWGTGPVPNVVATPIPGAQWVKSTGQFPLELVQCENSGDPKVPVEAKLQPYH